jgi:hypothetical protein
MPMGVFGGHGNRAGGTNTNGTTNAAAATAVLNHIICFSLNTESR